MHLHGGAPLKLCNPLLIEVLSRVWPKIIIAIVNGELTVKRLAKSCIELHAENAAYLPINICGDQRHTFCIVLYEFQMSCSPIKIKVTYSQNL